jgi:hypothetical protein
LHDDSTGGVVAKANMILADGTKVTVEGTTEEVSALLECLSNTGGGVRHKRGSRRLGLLSLGAPDPDEEMVETGDPPQPGPNLGDGDHRHVIPDG